MRPALLWVAIEFAGRVATLALAIGLFMVWLDAEPSPAQAGIASWCLLVVTHVVLWAFFDRRRRRMGQSLHELGYRFTWKAGVQGAACGLALVAAVRFTAEIDTRLFGLAGEPARFQAFVQAGVWAVLPFLLGNAVLAPVVEEFAWRGHIQTVLARERGDAAAFVGTALLFAAKHVLVDLSLERSASLIVGSLLLGLVRLCFGTFAATVAHFGLNFVASTALIVAALRQ